MDGIFVRIQVSILGRSGDVLVYSEVLLGVKIFVVAVLMALGHVIAKKARKIRSSRGE